jgi:hypothetical protein
MDNWLLSSVSWYEFPSHSEKPLHKITLAIDSPKSFQCEPPQAMHAFEDIVDIVGSM